MNLPPIPGNPVLNALNNIYQTQINAASAQYTPQQFQADIDLKKGQASEVPFRNALLQAQAGEFPYKNALLSAQTNLANSTAETKPYLNAMRQLQIARLGGQLGALQNGGNALNAPSSMMGLRPGTTFVDPTTGQIMSNPTTGSTNYMQRAILASQQLQPLLGEIAEGQAPYLGAKGNATHAVDAVRNYLGVGSDDSLGRQNKYTTSEANLNVATEIMLKAFGLNSTHENFKAMRDVVQPRRGEDPENFKKRLSGEAERLQQRQMQYQNALSGGYALNQNPPLPLSAQESEKLSQQFAGTPLTIGSGQPGSMNNSTTKGEPINLPSFSNKDDFRNWYAKQSPETQAKVRAQLGR